LFFAAKTKTTAKHTVFISGRVQINFVHVKKIDSPVFVVTRRAPKASLHYLPPKIFEKKKLLHAWHWHANGEIPTPF